MTHCLACKQPLVDRVCSAACETLLEVVALLRGHVAPWMTVGGTLARIPSPPSTVAGKLEFFLWPLEPGTVVEIFWDGQFYRVVVDEWTDRVQVSPREV